MATGGETSEPHVIVKFVYLRLLILMYQLVCTDIK